MNFQVMPQESTGRVPETLDVTIFPDTTLKGTPSMRNLSVGDEVYIEIRKNQITDEWIATTVETSHPLGWKGRTWGKTLPYREPRKISNKPMQQYQNRFIETRRETIVHPAVYLAGRRE